MKRYCIRLKDGTQTYVSCDKFLVSTQGDVEFHSHLGIVAYFASGAWSYFIAIDTGRDC